MNKIKLNMRDYLTVLLFALTGAYYSQWIEVIHSNSDTNHFFFLYFFIFLLISFAIITAYKSIIHKSFKLVSKSLFIVSMLLFVMTILLGLYTINEKNKIYNEYDGNNKDISIKEQSQIFRNNLDILTNLNKILLIVFLVVSSILTFVLDSLQLKKNNILTKKNVLKLLGLNVCIYGFIYGVSIGLFNFITIIRFIAGLG